MEHVDNSIIGWTQFQQSNYNNPRPLPEMFNYGLMTLFNNLTIIFNMWSPFYSLSLIPFIKLNSIGSFLHKDTHTHFWKNPYFNKINFTRLTSLLLGDPLTLQSCVSLILYCIVWYQDHVSFKFHLPPCNNQTYPYFHFPFTKTTSLSSCLAVLNACLILLVLNHYLLIILVLLYCSERISV